MMGVGVGMGGVRKEKGWGGRLEGRIRVGKRFWEGRGKGMIWDGSTIEKKLLSWCTNLEDWREMRKN